MPSAPLRVAAKRNRPKMTDLRDPRLIYAKGGLFLLSGGLAGGLLLAEVASWRIAFLLAVTVWCFCRAYYFAFYVIQHYVDPGYKFAGLGSFLRYLWSRTRAGRNFAASQIVSPVGRLAKS